VPQFERVAHEGDEDVVEVVGGEGAVGGDAHFPAELVPVAVDESGFEQAAGRVFY